MGRRASLDNSALMDRTVVTKGNRKKKKVTLNFDELEDDDAKNSNDNFAQSMSSDINMKKTKPISEKSKASPTSPSDNKKKKKYGMGMGGLLAKTGGFKRKSKNKSNAVNKQDKDAKETESKTSTLKRKRSRSFSKSITDKPLIDETENQKKPSTATPTPMIVNSTMLKKNALKSSTTKTEEKIMEVVAKKDNIVQIRCFAALTEYILYKKGENGKGLMIESFVDNKYG